MLGKDGTVRGMGNGNCLDVRGAGTANGTRSTSSPATAAPTSSGKR
ncbi:hypothetical protein NKH18_16875 [Streptomyces sp. M10(2022)]